MLTQKVLHITAHISRKVCNFLYPASANWDPANRAEAINKYHRLKNDMVVVNRTRVDNESPIVK